jgi:hypothetical protein
MKDRTYLLFVSCHTLVPQLSNKRFTYVKQVFESCQTEKKKGLLN